MTNNGLQGYKDFLLNNIPYSKEGSGGREVIVPCKYCSDGIISARKDHYHMYISIPQDENSPSLFRCFKCNTSGIVTYQRLLEWGIFDTEWNNRLASYNRSISSNPNSIININASILKFRWDQVTDDEVSKYKISVINRRLGTNFTIKEIIENKIILNLWDYLKQNNVTKYTRDPRIINDLDTSFIGFLSYDNNFVGCRNLTKVGSGAVYKTVDQRYVIYNVLDKMDNTLKFYIPPVNIDLLNPNPIKVHIAEGQFDILSIKYNLRKEFDHNIYAAITGNTYKGLLRHIISTFRLANLEVHVYLDNDVESKQDKYVVSDLVEYLRPFGYPLYIHRNMIGKDMGVSINNIQESIVKVL